MSGMIEAPINHSIVPIHSLFDESNHRLHRGRSYVFSIENNIRPAGVECMYVLPRYIRAHRPAGVAYMYVLLRHIHALSPRRVEYVCSTQIHTRSSPAEVAYEYVLYRYIHAPRLAGVECMRVLSRYTHAQSPRSGRIHVCSIKTRTRSSPRRVGYVCSIQTHTRSIAS